MRSIGLSLNRLVCKKVDVFSLGNIFYMLLQGMWPYDDVRSSKAQEMVMEGKGPTVYWDVWNSTEPVNQTLKTAMMMCHTREPDERPSSREVESFLKKQLEELDPEYEKTICAGSYCRSSTQ